MYGLDLKQGDSITFDYIESLESNAKKKQCFFIGYTENTKDNRNVDCIVVYDTRTKTFNTAYFYKSALYVIEKEEEKCNCIDKLALDYTKEVMLGNMPAVQPDVHFKFLDLFLEHIPVLVQKDKYYAPDITFSYIDEFTNYSKFGVHSMSEFKPIENIDTYVRDLYLSCFEKLKETEPRIVIVRDNEILKQAEFSKDKNFFTDGSCFKIVRKMIDSAQEQGIGSYLRKLDYVPKFSQVEMDSILRM